MYRTDLINAAMGAKRLTNEQVALRAKVAPKTVSAIRNGYPNIYVPTLKAVADALGIEMYELFRHDSKKELAA
jgi:transcriptional regulator with XRE-family HTH domain